MHTHTHRHTNICLPVCAARDPGQREVCGWWPEEKEAGATCLTDKTYTHTHTHTGTHMSCKWSTTTGNRFGTDSNQNKWLNNKNYPTLAKGQCIHTKNIFKKKKSNNKEMGNKLNKVMLLLIFKLIMRWEQESKGVARRRRRRSRREPCARAQTLIRTGEPNHKFFKFAALSATCLDTNTVIKPAYIHAHTHRPDSHILMHKYICT